MTNHVHLIIGTQKEKMQDILRDFKSYTSSQLKKLIIKNPHESRKEWILWMMERAGSKNGNNHGYQFWQQHNHPIELSGNEMMQQKMEYIHNNPVVAGIVERPEDYIYSSAKDYAGAKGLLNIEFIE